jgi:hypothetical protein
MRFVALFIVLALGCDSPPAKLEYRAIGLAEGTVPLGVVIKIENTGDQVGYVDIVGVNITQSKVVAADPGASDKIALPVALYDGENPAGTLENVSKGKAVAIEPGELVDLRCGVAWGVGDSPQPMLALARVQFIAVYQDQELLRNKPRTILVQSLPGVLKRVLAQPPDDPRQAKDIVEEIDAIGEPTSDSVRRCAIIWPPGARRTESPQQQRLIAAQPSA